jgi:hypothetical protein
MVEEYRIRDNGVWWCGPEPRERIGREIQALQVGGGDRHPLRCLLTLGTNSRPE